MQPTQRLQTLRHLDQQRVARAQPLRLVDGLEMIQVQRKHRQGLPRQARRRQQRSQSLLEVGAVGQAGQLVVARQPLDAFLRRAPLGDVACNTAHLDAAIVGIAYQVADDLGPDDAAVLAQLGQFQHHRFALGLTTGFESRQPTGQQCSHPRGGLRRQTRFQRLRHHLLRLHATQTPHRRTNISQTLRLGIKRPDHISQRFGQLAAAALAAPQLLGGLLQPPPQPQCQACAHDRHAP